MAKFCARIENELVINTHIWPVSEIESLLRDQEVVDSNSTAPTTLPLKNKAHRSTYAVMLRIFLTACSGPFWNNSAPVSVPTEQGVACR